MIIEIQLHITHSSVRKLERKVGCFGQSTQEGLSDERGDSTIEKLFQVKGYSHELLSVLLVILLEQFNTDCHFFQNLSRQIDVQVDQRGSFGQISCGQVQYDIFFLGVPFDVVDHDITLLSEKVSLKQCHLVLKLLTTTHKTERKIANLNIAKKSRNDEFIFAIFDENCSLHLSLSKTVKRANN